MVVYQAYRTGDPTEYVSANPIEYITHYTGDWTIRFICFTLCITPLRMLLNRPQITRFRRMLGLFAFFYGCVHLAVWLFLDPRQNTISAIWEDIVKRRYITVGMLAFLAMLPLAITSTAGWVRRLGFKRWKKLHRLVYLTAVAARDPLLVAGEVRYPAAADVRRHRDRAAGISRVSSGCASASGRRPRAAANRLSRLSVDFGCALLPRREEPAPPRNCVPGPWPCTARRPPGGSVHRRSIPSPAASWWPRSCT